VVAALVAVYVARYTVSASVRSKNALQHDAPKTTLCVA
jgi:hypothetical protein